MPPTGRSRATTGLRRRSAARAPDTPVKTALNDQHEALRTMSLGRSETMASRAVPFTLLVAAIGFFGAAGLSAWAEGGDEAALAAAMTNASATLQGGLKASEAQGTPISAKFEIEDGKLQLSVYTMKGSDFMEVVADPNTGTIAKAEKITDAGDLKEAAEQKAAMAKAKVPLLTATETAVNANAGSRAVSVVPELKNGQATAEVTLLQGTSFKKVTEKLD
jgi:hypothetical protein